MTYTPDWAIDDAIERERQDEFLILVRHYAHASTHEQRTLSEHFNEHQDDEPPHWMDQCPSLQEAKTKADLAYAEIERRVRGCSPTPGFMETING